MCLNAFESPPQSWVHSMLRTWFWCSVLPWSWFSDFCGGGVLAFWRSALPFLGCACA